MKLLLILAFILSACSSPQKAEEPRRVRVEKKADKRIVEEKPVLEKRVVVDYKKFNLAVKNLNEKVALSEASIILQKKKDDARTLNGLAFLHRKKGRLKLSEVISRRVLMRDEMNSQARKNLGQVFLKRGSEEKALQEWLKVLKTNPEEVDLQRNVASIYLKHGAFRAAEGHLKNVLQKSPEDFETRFVLGQTYNELQEFQSSQKVFRGLKRYFSRLDVAKGYITSVEGSRDVTAEDAGLLRMVMQSHVGLQARAKSLIPQPTEVKSAPVQ